MRFPLSKGQKIGLLLLALLPFLFIGVYLFMFFSMFLDGFEGFVEQSDPNEIPFRVWRLMIPMALAGISQLAVFILYLLHAMKNPRLKEGNDRLVWILVLLFANFIGAIIYWRMQIWQEKEKNFQDAYAN